MELLPGLSSEYAVLRTIRQMGKLHKDEQNQRLASRNFSFSLNTQGSLEIGKKKINTL